MKISVVVPAFNEEKLIDQSLAAIKSSCSAFDQLGWTHGSFHLWDGRLRHEPHGTTYELECEPFIAPMI